MFAAVSTFPPFPSVIYSPILIEFLVFLATIRNQNRHKFASERRGREGELVDRGRQQALISKRQVQRLHYSFAKNKRNILPLSLSVHK